MKTPLRKQGISKKKKKRKCPLAEECGRGRGGKGKEGREGRQDREGRLEEGRKGKEESNYKFLRRINTLKLLADGSGVNKRLRRGWRRVIKETVLRLKPLLLPAPSLLVTFPYISEID